MYTAATFGVAVPQLDEPRVVQPVRGPPPRRAGDPAPVMMRRVQDRLIDRGIDAMVVHRLFSAGLALESALGLMGDHPVAGRIQEVISELDLVIRDFRTALFDRYQPRPRSSEQPS
jgi:hypothetical protein